MSSLPDAERDASEVVQLLAALAALLSRRDAVVDDDTRLMLDLALTGGLSAARVLNYLHALQGSGDGAAISVPSHLGPWRDWSPTRGNLLGEPATATRIEELPPRRRRCDPGE